MADYSGATDAQSAGKVSVLFVCLGNICRSPMAEGCFRILTNFGQPNQHPLINEIDSCGTGAYHAGDYSDSRTMSVLEEHGVTTYRHRARKIKVPEDFERFDYILAMDEDNVMDIKEMVKKAKKRGVMSGDGLEKVHLYGEFGEKSKDEEVGDPYYGGRDGFEVAYEQVSRFGQGLLKHIEKEAAST